MIREDIWTGKRLTNAGRVFLVALAMLGGSLVWMMITGESNGGVATRTQSLLFCGSGLLSIASGVYTVNCLGRLWWWYRCPQCGGKAKRVEDNNLRLRYKCGKCHVEWDTGWDDVPEGSD